MSLLRLLLFALIDDEDDGTAEAEADADAGAMPFELTE